MNAVLQTQERLLLSITAEELTGICNALNEVCHGVDIDDIEFPTRLGVSRSFLAKLLHQLHAGVPQPALMNCDRTEAWADGGSVQAICVTVFGDPVDMNSHEAQEFANKLLASIREAGG